jgi:hypothetical protein
MIDDKMERMNIEPINKPIESYNYTPIDTQVKNSTNLPINEPDRAVEQKLTFWHVFRIPIIGLAICLIITLIVG